MVNEKRLTVQVHRVQGGYELSFRLPPETYFSEALKRGFETTGSNTRVLVDSTTLVINPKGEDWLIHHEDNAHADPDKAFAKIEVALRKWLSGLGYVLEFKES